MDFLKLLFPSTIYFGKTFETNKPRRSNEQWTDHEDEVLRKYVNRADSEIDVAWLAKQHERSKSAIRSRLEKLNLIGED